MNRLVVVVVSVAVVFHHVIALISKPITVSVKSSYNCVENYQNANYRGNSFSVHANSYIDSQSYSQCHSRSYSNSFGNSYDNNRITKLHSSLQPKDDFITSKQSLLRYKLHLLSVHVRNTLSYPKRKLIDTKNKLQHFFTNQLPMLHYLWPKDDFRLKSFLILSLVAMFLGKWFNIKVPFILQRTIDTISQTASVSNSVAGSITKSATNPSINVLSTASIAILYYGLSRALSVIFSEIKTCLFTNVSQNVLRKFANEIFTHLHSLDSQFHLRTPSGVVSVAYVRAIRGFQGFMFQLIFSVLPTILELFLVSKILYTKFGMIFTMITLLTFISYLSFTIFITQWRVEMRQEIVDIDNQRNGFFIDSILNHEIVKLFTNEQKESKRFDSYLKKLEELAINNTYAIALLNLGQAVLFSIGLTASLFVALRKVNSGVMSIGDLVAINSMLLQLAIPFNFMGYTYQELRQSLVDMGYISSLLSEKQSIVDSPDAVPMEILAPRDGPSSVEFKDVSFVYPYDYETATDSKPTGNTPADANPIQRDGMLLNRLTFKIEKGQNVAIVGPSGSGKSTTLKLITRMLDPVEGSVLIDGVEINKVTKESLRQRISIVPQDTCLFDDTILYNIKYGNSEATDEEVQRAIQKSNLKHTIEKFSDGINTPVGERGARLSGGERQKVSIARAILRDPSLILCDEVTSSVDAFAEKEIVETLRKASDSRTTITVAHRLSSVAHCDKIIVIYRGTVAEEGTHDELLRIPNGVYKNMWDAQHTYIVDDGITPYTQDDTMIMSELPKTNTVVHDYGEVGKRTAHTPEKHEDESLMYVPKAEDEGLSSISTEDTMSESLTSQDTANMSNAEHAMAMRKEEKDISMVGGGDAANTGSTVSGTSSIVAHSASPATTVTTTQKDVVEVQIPNGEMSGTTFVSVPSGGMNTASISLDEAMDLNKNNHED